AFCFRGCFDRPVPRECCEWEAWASTCAGWAAWRVRLADPFAGRRIVLFACALVLQQRLGVVRAHRLAEVIALRIFAAELRELDRIRIGFGAFGHYFHAEIVRERDDRTQDHGARALAVRPYEGLVDLDGVEWEALQVGERGVAAAEIVECQARAKVADALQHLRGVLGILHHQRFRKLELERAACKACARNPRAQVVDEVLPQQLPRRYVDAGEHRIAAAHGTLPRAQLAGAALQHEHTEVDDEADLLGHGHELGRRGAAHFWVIPARHRFEARDRAVLEPHDPLVADGGLLALADPPHPSI